MEWTCKTCAIFYRVSILSPLTAVGLGRHGGAFPLWVTVLAEDAAMRNRGWPNGRAVAPTCPMLALPRATAFQLILTTPQSSINIPI